MLRKFLFVALSLLPSSVSAQIIGGGSVTSVGITPPAIMTAGAPVTTTGNITLTLNSQTANQVLASPNGSSGVPTFRALATIDIPPSATGCSPIELYGGGTGVSDNTAAWNSFVTAIGSGSACLYFGPGTYTFTSGTALAISLAANQSVSIRGQSMSGTLLKFTNGGGIAFTYASQIASVHVRDLTAVTSLTPSPSGTTAAFTLTSTLGQGNNLLNTFTNVGCSGLDRYTGGTNNFWNYCIYDSNVPMVDIINPQIWGASSQLGGGGGGTGIFTIGTGTGTGPFPAVINIYGGDIQNTNVGVNYSTNSQGMTINATSFVFVNTGVISNGNTQLSITNSEFDAIGTNISQTGDTADLIVQGNLIYANINATGIYINNGERMTFGGNSVVCTSLTGTIGININATDAFNSGTITGNSIRNCNQGVNLGASSVKMVLGPNSYYNNNTNWTNSAGNANSVLEPFPASMAYNGPAGLVDFTAGANGYRFDNDVSVLGGSTNARMHADSNNGYLLGNTTNTGFNSFRPFQWNLSTGVVTIDGTGVGASFGGNLKLALSTVSGLPTCAAGSEGAARAVSDANSTTFNAALVGGGTNHMIAYCNGSGWVVH